MRLTSSSLVLLELAASALAVPLTVDVEVGKGVTAPKPNHARANEVKQAFEQSWNGYVKHAFPHDTLHPVSNSYEDDRAAWGVTVVDALSTAIIMEKEHFVAKMLDHISKIDFTTTAKENDAISLFETNIRYLAGLLSGYDLLKGPFSGLVKDAAKVQNLLDQAKSLADSLSIAFNTTSGVPQPTVYLNPTRRHGNSSSNNIAEVGTLILEWTRLSDLSGDGKYAQLAEKAESYLLRPTGSPEAFPGMVGGDVSIADGKFINSDGGWSGGTDSFYEYLIKMYQYDPAKYGEYKDRWVLAADSTIKYLASHPTSRKDLTFLSQYSGQKTIPVSTHLASFAGGNFILGGVLLGSDKYKQFGLDLTTSYFNNYQQAPAGIGPEVFQWVDAALPANDTNNAPPPDAQKDFYAKSGFYTTAGSYILRPETSESLYYAYRLTGDRKYQDMAWQAFSAIKKVCKTGDAYAQLNDVMQTNGGGYIDQMQSFWLAETLKYLYLIFAKESDVQLQFQGGTSKYVFNTEAHPFRVKG
ncbi:maturation of Asn-linked oligosaccharides protein [Purpureocillium lilacinum]|uniref:alpha-1,2-Mannosidase n=1 Tax=Purpureocillium lilacinum TaxID=33203 RepID=A0A179GXW2_PURLI|nr:mannosyl-oligosaccharide alpha-1,2-mannosidase precursor [Purpureocillium lilacinum]GJN73642.1 maturation of Asn-linked oligosaccharides protein [Purpureocillium lilacinum]GJN84152.1 maturation of Asn-linked oligosaccharides protein [Purpureocillium lilacinum]